MCVFSTSAIPFKYLKAAVAALLPSGCCFLRSNSLSPSSSYSIFSSSICALVVEYAFTSGACAFSIQFMSLVRLYPICSLCPTLDLTLFDMAFLLFDTNVYVLQVHIKVSMWAFFSRQPINPVSLVKFPLRIYISSIFSAKKMMMMRAAVVDGGVCSFCPWIDLKYLYFDWTSTNIHRQSHFDISQMVNQFFFLLSHRALSINLHQSFVIFHFYGKILYTWLYQ